jgi:site-specific DNA-methyltransferase (adenine-specific)
LPEKKGADSGIDGIAFMLVGHEEHKQVLFSVKSGHIGVPMIRDFCHVVDRDKAAMGIFITLEEPTKPMIMEAKNMGNYINPLTNQEYPKIEIVTIKELLNDKRLNLPQAVEVLKEAQIKKAVKDNPLGLDF